MFYRFLGVTVLLAAFLVCTPTYAAPFTGGSVTVSVPDGWTPSYTKNKPDDLRLAAPRNEYTFSLLLGPSNGMDPKQGAEMISKMLKGTTPEQTKNPDVYRFTSFNGGLRCVATVSGKRLVVFMEGGNALKFKKEIQSIMQSLASTDADEQKIFEKMKDFF